jgi:hypothetical protein
MANPAAQFGCFNFIERGPVTRRSISGGHWTKLFSAEKYAPESETIWPLLTMCMGLMPCTVVATERQKIKTECRPHSMPPPRASPSQRLTTLTRAATANG